MALSSIVRDKTAWKSCLIMTLILTVVVIVVFCIFASESNNAVRDKIATQLKERWNGTVIQAKGDGNCLVNAFCQHLQQKQTRECANQQREDIVLYTIRNEDKDPFTMIPSHNEHKTFGDYGSNGEWLLWEHLVAWHELRGINVILFECNKGKGEIIVTKYLDDDNRLRKVAGILHINGNHWDYVDLPQDIDALEALPAWNIGKFPFDAK